MRRLTIRRLMLAVAVSAFILSASRSVTVRTSGRVRGAWFSLGGRRVLACFRNDISGPRYQMIYWRRPDIYDVEWGVGIDENGVCVGKPAEFTDLTDVPRRVNVWRSVWLW